MTGLQQKIEKKLKDAKVDFVCEFMGIDFYTNFIEPYKDLEEDPYEKHIWKTVKHSKAGHTICAIPQKEKFDVVPWEEWFLMDGAKNHILLYTEKPEKCDGEWKGELDDTDHPEEVLGYQWYYTADDGMVPFFLKEK